MTANWIVIFYKTVVLTLISVFVILMFRILVIQAKLQNIPISNNVDWFKENTK